MISEEGLDHVWRRHSQIAQAVWAACEAWGNGGPMKLNIENSALRSNAVTALTIGAPYGKQLRRWTEHEAGLTLGIGLNMSTPDDPNADGYFRIGHMGHVNAHMIMGTLGSIQAGLIALNIPHGPGGLEAAARVLAK